VGNDEGQAGLEITLSGPTLRFPAGGVVALTGAGLKATRSSGVAAGWNETLVLGEGETLALEHAATGCRCWLAVQGGIVERLIMGSRSTFFPAGFGGHQGRPLRAGDVLEGGTTSHEVHLKRASCPTSSPQEAPFRVIAGPQAGLFDDAGLAAFFSGEYQVGASSDRRGLRLAGPVVSYSCIELPSQGVLPGAIQVPPDGQPIILGWDGPVTGGYPVIAGVISADWPRLAQLRPGDALRFVTIEHAAARMLAPAEWIIEVLA
jgi:biotin-dependent carboxylase-like uncharacterized protein